MPEKKENACEAQHTASIRKKQAAIDEVRKFYLKETCSPVTALYDHRLPGKLAAYEHEVIRMRAEGITNAKIHEAICQKGYDGSVASLRIFMQKERTRRKTAAD